MRDAFGKRDVSWRPRTLVMPVRAMIVPQGQSDFFSEVINNSLFQVASYEEWPSKQTLYLFYKTSSHGGRPTGNYPAAPTTAILLCFVFCLSTVAYRLIQGFPKCGSASISLDVVSKKILFIFCLFKMHGCVRCHSSAQQKRCQLSTEDRGWNTPRSCQIKVWPPHEGAIIQQ